MRPTAWLALLLAGLALASAPALEADPRVPLGGELNVRATGLPPGLYALEIEGPRGVRVVSVEAPKGELVYRFEPAEPGRYRFRLATGAEVLSAESEVYLPPPHLTEEGLWLAPGRVVPLPEPGSWLGPVVEDEAVYLARGLLVLEVSPGDGSVTRRYPPAPVKAVYPGPEFLLEGGRRLGLAEFRRLPYLAPWEELGALARLEEALGPYRGYRPYWSFLAEGRFDGEALAAMGPDLLRRGHRPELYWGADTPFSRLPDLAREKRGEGLDESLALTRFVFDYLPGLPQAPALFREQADWLWAQGRLAEATRLRYGLDWVTRYHYRGLADILKTALLIALAAYLALLVKGLIAWRGRGRLPLSRLSWIERLIGLLLLAAVALLVLALPAATSAERALSGPLSRATLETDEARRYLESLPPGRERELLTDWPEADLAWDTMNGAVLHRLGLGGDPWSRVYREAGVERPPGPVGSDLLLLTSLAELRRVWKSPWRALSGAFSPPIAALIALGLVLAALLQVTALFAPGRPERSWAVLTWEALVPGLPAFEWGVGLLVFLAAAWAALRLAAGDDSWAWVVVAGYLFNLAVLARRPR